MYKFVLLLCYFLSFSAYSGEVKIADVFYVLKVDGKEFSTNFFASETNLQLSSGKHVILMEYKDIFEGEDDGHTKITSEPFLVILEADNRDIIINKPLLEDIPAARKFSQNPKLQITDLKNKLISHQVHFLDDVKASNEQALLSNVNLSANITDTVKIDESHATTQDTLEKVEKQGNAPITKKHSQSKNSGSDIKHLQEPVALDMLNYWWQQASDEQRNAFISKINNK